MIYWLNGPFGVGKTETAKQLKRLVPHSVVLDPERIGWILQRVLRTDDFQDLRSWRVLTSASINVLDRLGISVIVPMTVWNRDYLAELLRGIRRRELLLVQLAASEQELRSRIARRRAYSTWSLEHLPHTLNMQHDPAYGLVIPTDGRTPFEVAQAVLRVVSLRAAHTPLA